MKFEFLNFVLIIRTRIWMQEIRYSFLKVKMG